ncbi:MAG TPA: MoaD/ThiS family protein [Candidatus Acetothermia bacterium]|nr:MoaD/ThiS family protein [Candidatus Acetothermia bacterium]
MRVKVLLFAGLREAAGEAELELELPEGATVEGLLTALEKERPRLSRLLPLAKVAVNRRVARKGTEIHPGDEVALIPPVGGG